MKHARVRATRAYLKIAGLSAILLQIVAPVCIVFFGLQPASFKKTWFRWLAAGTLALIALVRIAGRVASALMVAVHSSGNDAPAGGVVDGAKGGVMQFLCRIDNCFSAELNEG